MKVLKNFGEFVKEKRKSLGLSQEKLAELSDMSIRGLIKIEQGQSNVRFINLIRLCVALNISIGELEQFYSHPYSDFDEADIIDVRFIRR